MSKFKVGDRVKRIEDSNIGNRAYSSKDLLNGENGFTIVKINPYRQDSIHCHYDYSTDDWIEENDLELIDNKLSNMNLKEKFVTAFLGEPEKSFRKVGVTNGDGVLTIEGQEIFLSWLLKGNGEKFKTEVVDVLLEEEKKDK